MLWGGDDAPQVGPTPDGRTKPDIVAPGDSITSAASDGFAHTRQCTVDTQSGTSMAAPLVAAGAVLVRLSLSLSLSLGAPATPLTTSPRRMAGPAVFHARLLPVGPQDCRGCALPHGHARQSDPHQRCRRHGWVCAQFYLLPIPMNMYALRHAGRRSPTGAGECPDVLTRPRGMEMEAGSRRMGCPSSRLPRVDRASAACTWRRRCTCPAARARCTCRTVCWAH
jgi:hypothetical protein